MEFNSDFVVLLCSAFLAGLLSSWIIYLYFIRQEFFKFQTSFEQNRVYLQNLKEMCEGLAAENKRLGKEISLSTFEFKNILADLTCNKIRTQKKLSLNWDSTENNKIKLISLEDVFEVKLGLLQHEIEILAVNVEEASKTLLQLQYPQNAMCLRNKHVSNSEGGASPMIGTRSLFSKSLYGFCSFQEKAIEQTADTGEENTRTGMKEKSKKFCGFERRVGYHHGQISFRCTKQSCSGEKSFSAFQKAHCSSNGQHIFLKIADQALIDVRDILRKEFSVEEMALLEAITTDQLIKDHMIIKKTIVKIEDERKEEKNAEF